MYSISGTTIKMTRGDTLIVALNLTYDGESYTPAEGDVIKFMACKGELNSTKSAYKDNTILIEKTIPNDTMVLRLNPNDTKQLSFGTYAYDMEITFEDGRVDTFIQGQKLVIMPEVG